MRCLLALLLPFAFAGCASVPQAPLRVLVYNIHAGKDAGGVDNLERVAALIRAADADLVLLQEVDRGTTRSGKVDQLETLMRLTGMQGVFGKSLDYQGGDYGIAILARWPIAGAETVPLHVTPPQTRAGGSIEPRVALFAHIESPRGRISVANTHLDASGEDTWRRQEVARLLETIAARPSPPLLVGGDFNATPDSAVVATLLAAGLRDEWPRCGEGNALTYPANAPVKRIDYLFLTGAARCQSARVMDTTASDHRPVQLAVELRVK